VVVDTSGRLYDDFSRLLFLHPHHESSVLTNELPEESDQFYRSICHLHLLTWHSLYRVWRPSNSKISGYLRRTKWIGRERLQVGGVSVSEWSFDSITIPKNTQLITKQLSIGFTNVINHVTFVNFQSRLLKWIKFWSTNVLKFTSLKGSTTDNVLSVTLNRFVNLQTFYYIWVMTFLFYRIKGEILKGDP
jgi:hypothetical protein